MTRDEDGVMPGSDGLRILGDFWKKNSELRFETGRVSWDAKLGESSWNYGMCARLLGQWVEIWGWTNRVEIWRWTKRVDFRIWTRPVQLCATGCANVCWVSELGFEAGRSEMIFESGRGQSSYVPRDAPRVCWVKWNSQHSKNCVSLSSCRKT